MLHIAILTASETEYGAYTNLSGPALTVLKSPVWTRVRIKSSYHNIASSVVLCNARIV